MITSGVIGPRQVSDNEIIVNTGNGYGSTDTMVRRFTTSERSSGGAITRATSATTGDTFTINESGIYAIVYSDTWTSAGTIGISLNSTQKTTSIASITAANRLGIGSCAANGFVTVSCVKRLSAGDVIRAHSDSVVAGTGATTRFQITKVGLS